MSDNGQVKLQKIDPGKLKLRELAEVERQVGRRLAGELQSGELGMDTMQALLWVTLRKQDPAATFEQAGEYDLQELMALFADDEEEGEGENPTPAIPSDGAIRSSSPASENSRLTPPSITSGV
jgi:hypothetical protein